MPSETMEAKRLLERATFEWQPLAPLYAELMTLIAPGKALRRYALMKARSDAERTGEGPVRPPLSKEEQIRSGANRMVKDCVKGFVARGRIELCEIDGAEHYRFKERRQSVRVCAHCGMDPKGPESVPAMNLIPGMKDHSMSPNVIPFPQRMSRKPQNF